MPLEPLSGPKAQHVAWLALGITVDLTGSPLLYLCLFFMPVHRAQLPLSTW